MSTPNSCPPYTTESGSSVVTTNSGTETHSGARVRTQQLDDLDAHWSNKCAHYMLWETTRKRNLHNGCYDAATAAGGSEAGVPMRDKSSLITSFIFRIGSPWITFFTSSLSSVSCSISASASYISMD
jgi:hypothetical protein